MSPLDNVFVAKIPRGVFEGLLEEVVQDRINEVSLRAWREVGVVLDARLRGVPHDGSVLGDVTSISSQSVRKHPSDIMKGKRVDSSLFLSLLELPIPVGMVGLPLGGKDFVVRVGFCHPNEGFEEFRANRE